MSRTLIAATHNPNKLIELSRILAPKGIEVMPPPDKAILKTIVEDGDTFAQNALIKAKTICKAFGLPTISDDSGLCIDALGGRPGVQSARYLGEETPYTVKNAAILRELEGVMPERRTARFICAVALVTPDGEWVFEGSCEGVIGDMPRGENGFGYDPIFYVGGKSYSELSDVEKDAVSHRARALAKLAGAINDLL